MRTVTLVTGNWENGSVTTLTLSKNWSLNLGEVSASLRNRAVRFTNRSGSGSVSHVFREQGIHIVADTVAEVVADDAYSIHPGD